MSNDTIQSLVSLKTSELSAAIVGARAAHRPLMINGSPGLGKSAASLDAADILRAQLGLDEVVQLGDVPVDPKRAFGYYDVRLTNMGVEEFGLPVPDHETGVQKRMPVDWFPSADRTDIPDHGILIFEEVVSAPPAMQAATYQITHDKRLGDKVMKPGWQVVLTGNLLTDGGVVHKMPTPLANRLIHVYVKSDVDGWCDWALTHGVEPVVVGFIRFRNDLLNTFETYVKKKQEGHAFATERSWEITSDLMKSGVSGRVNQAMVAGTIGVGPAFEFQKFLQTWESMPNIDGIMADPHNAPIPDDGATRYAVCSALAARAKPDNFGRIVSYAERMPAEFMMLCITDSTRRNKDCMSTPEMVRLSVKHTELFTG